MLTTPLIPAPRWLRLLAHQLSIGFLALALWPAAAAAQPLSIANYTLVRERAVSGSVSEYEYRPTLANGGPSVVGQVAATVVALLPTTTVVDRAAGFSNVPARGTRIAGDTFILRRPRAFPFTPAELVWTFSVNGSFAIGSYTLLRERRVDAIRSDYDYRATLTNGGAAIAGAHATVTSALPTTTVLDGSLDFGAVPAGTKRQSLDSFTLRRLRGLPLVPEILAWTIVPTGSSVDAPPVARIAPVTSPVVAGAPVALDGRGSSDPGRRAPHLPVGADRTSRREPRHACGHHRHGHAHARRRRCLRRAPDRE